MILGLLQICFSENSSVLIVDFESFHNFDFAPGKNFVQKKSPRLRLREVVQRAGALEFTLQRVRHPHKLKLELQPGYRR